MTHIKQVIILFFLFTLSVIGITRTISNPQINMVGASTSSLGTTNPVLNGDIGAVFINPASLAEIEAMPLSITQKNIMGEFDYNIINFGIPIKMKLPVNRPTPPHRISLGLSYGSLILENIPNTIEDNGQIWKVGSFSSGVEIIQLTGATSFYDLFGFNILSTGVNLKHISQLVNGEESSTIGIDIGGIVSKHLEMPYVDKVSFGASIQNIIAPAITWEETGNETLLPFTFILGAGADLLDEKLHLYINNGIENVTVAGEFDLANGLFLRAAFESQRLSMGTGIIFDRVATGFAKRDYSLRLDYTYTEYSDTILENDPNHVFSISFLGASQPREPQILYPNQEIIITKSQHYPLSGLGQKNTTVRLYNHDALVQTTVSNKHGKWEAGRFPLKEGKNVVYVKSIDIKTDSSLESNRVTIFSDTIPPSLDIKINPIDNYNLEVMVVSNEQLTSIEGLIGDIELEFKSLKKEVIPEKSILKSQAIRVTLPNTASKWSATLPMPEGLVNGSYLKQEGMSYLEINAIDTAGNFSPITSIPFFFSMKFPNDKHVHYKDSLRFIGNTSETIKSLLINDNAVYLDSYNQFAIPIALEPGKNKISFKIKTLNEKDLEYFMRILRLVTYPDLNEKVKGRREIEFLSTIGVLEGSEDGNFYPDESVTREYIAKLMVLSNQDYITISEPEYDLFPDVRQNHPFAKYIQAGIENGLIFAFPDGTFKPSQTLTLAETVFLLSSAGIIEYQDVDSGDSYLTRAQLAEFLAYTPEYEELIERLIDWERGYK
jgi:hypothetical protein